MNYNKKILTALIIISCTNGFANELSTEFVNQIENEENETKSFDDVELKEYDTNTNVFNAIKDIKIGEEDSKDISSDKYSDYVNINLPYGCDGWKPLAKEIDLGFKFTQRRHCYQDKQLKEGIDALDREKIISIKVVEENLSIGTLDFIKETRYGEWTDWYQEDGKMKKTQSTTFIWASGRVQEAKPNVQITDID